MPNPELLVCDSDVLAQLFLANQLTPLRHLKDEFGVQPVIVEEVDTELRWLQNYKDRFIFQLDRALRVGNLQLLDRGLFQNHVAKAPLGASWEGFQTLGQQYDGRIHIGEAYTFAAALTLGLPAASNDYSAIRTLESNLLSLPSPVLRTFDLISFAFRTGALDAKQCDSVRGQLSGAKEYIPNSFKRASFEDGLSGFSSRLQEGPSQLSNDGSEYSRVLHLQRLERS